VLAVQHAVVLREGRDGVLRTLVRGAPVIVVTDIQVLTADEPDPQHYLGHGHAP
jgi:hypothetical protein